MFWVKDGSTTWFGYKCVGDKKTEDPRVVLICQDLGIGVRLDTDLMDANLDVDEVLEIYNKMVEINTPINHNRR